MENEKYCLFDLKRCTKKSCSKNGCQRTDSNEERVHLRNAYHKIYEKLEEPIRSILMYFWNYDNSKLLPPPSNLAEAIFFTSGIYRGQEICDKLMEISCSDLLESEVQSARKQVINLGK